MEEIRDGFEGYTVMLCGFGRFQVTCCRDWPHYALVPSSPHPTPGFQGLRQADGFIRWKPLAKHEETPYIAPQETDLGTWVLMRRVRLEAIQITLKGMCS
jgi:hypothetical protein